MRFTHVFLSAIIIYVFCTFFDVFLTSKSKKSKFEKNFLVVFRIPVFEFQKFSNLDFFSRCMLKTGHKTYAKSFFGYLDYFKIIKFSRSENWPILKLFDCNSKFCLPKFSQKRTFLNQFFTLFRMEKNFLLRAKNYLKNTLLNNFL